MEQLDSMIIDEFSDSYIKAWKEYSNLHQFGIQYIDALQADKRFVEIKIFLERSSFHLTDEIVSKLMQTQNLPILKYVHTHGYPMFSSSKIVPSLTMEIVKWLIRLKVKPILLFDAARCQYNLSILKYLLRNFQIVINGRYIESISKNVDVEIMLPMLQFLYSKDLVSFTDQDIKNAAKIGDAQLLQWLYSKISLTHQIMILSRIIKDRNVEMIRWIILNYDSDLSFLTRKRQKDYLLWKNSKPEDFIF